MPIEFDDFFNFDSTKKVAKPKKEPVKQTKTKTKAAKPAKSTAPKTKKKEEK